MVDVLLSTNDATVGRPVASSFDMRAVADDPDDIAITWRQGASR